MAAELRRRLALAEAGRWSELAAEYLEEREARTPSGRTSNDKGEVADRIDALDAAVRKAKGGCLRAAVQLLRGDARVPGTRQTKDALQQLVAMDVTSEEQAAIASKQVRRGSSIPYLRPCH